MSLSFHLTSTRLTGLIIASSLALTSCASSSSAPKVELGAAEMAVRQAEREDRAQQIAPAELQNARSKLETAQVAINNKEYVKARRFSEQAIVDAEVAIAKTEATKSNASARDEAEATRDLKNEISRTK